MKNQFLLIILSLMIYACSSSTGQDGDGDKNPFKLVYPEKGGEVHYCCFNFEWEQYENFNNYHVLVATDASFDNVVIDEYLEGLSLELEKGLKPGEEYFWKVEPGFTPIEAVSSFRIMDYTAKYEGKYDAKRRTLEKINGEVVEDVTVPIEIEISKSEVPNGLVINDTQFLYYNRTMEPDHIGIYEEDYSGSGGALFFVKDSISYYYVVYGDHGEMRTTITAKLN